jgi:hypothetical protein
MRLTYEIAADDRQLRRVLRGVEQEARSANRRMARDAQGGTFAQARRASTTGALKTEEAAARQAETYWRRAHQRATDHRIRQDERAHQARLRQVATEERAQARAAAQLDRQRSAALIRIHREGERADAKAQRARRGTAARIGAGAAMGVAGGIGRVASYGGMAAGLVGGFAAADALQEQVRVRRQAALLANQAGNPSLKAKIAAEAGNVAGLTGEQKLAGVSAFVGKTGNFAAGESLSQGLGQIHRIFGADFAELGEAAGHAFNVLKDTIKDPKELEKAVLNTAQTWAAQGAMGTIEIKDMAKIAGRMGASTRAFAGDAPGLLAEVGALGQLAAARGGASSAEEAATALSRVPSDIVQNRKKWQTAGIDVFADKSRTQLAGMTELLIRALEKTGGDLTKVTPLFNEESRKVFAGIAPIFQLAERENAKLAPGERKKAGVAGREAVLREVGGFTAATLTAEQLRSQDASVLEEESTRIVEAQKAFREKIGTELIPVLTKVIPKFTEAIPALAKFTGGVASVADYVLDNPWKGAFAIIGASIAKDLAAAGIQSAFQSGIQSMFAGGMAGGALKVGSVALAATTVTFAVQSWQELVRSSGGDTGALGAGAKSALTGGNFFEAFDAYLNAKAKRDPASTPPALPVPQQAVVKAGGVVLGKQADGQAVTQAQFDAVPKANQEEFLRTAAELTAAGKALKDAADALKKSGGTEASRTAPMVSPSRG